MRNLRRVSSTLVLLYATTAWADIPVNSSYLSDTKYTGDKSTFIILDSGRELQLAQQYNVMVKAYEAKQNAGTLTISDQVNYNASASAFTQGVLTEVKNYQQNAQTNKLVGAIKKDPNVMAAAEAAKYPAIVIGSAWSAYNGASYTVLKTEHLSITPSESIKGKSASLALASPILNASVAANMDSITTNVNRGLIDHVSVNFSNMRPLQPSNPPASTVSLNYGISI